MSGTSQRDAFWNRVYEHARTDSNVLIVSADMGAPALDRFKKDLPRQYIDVGIAEQQAIAVATGLALEGKKVFTYAITPFISLRCFEHIRVNLAGMKLPVTIVGVGAGFSYDDSGPTHHSVEDMGILRTLPWMNVTSITDTVMARAFADISRTLDHPNYIRLDREQLGRIYNEDEDFTKGLALLRPASQTHIIAAGTMVYKALEAADALRGEGLDIGVIDLYTLPVNIPLLLETISGARRIITLEEHTLPGGLGSAVCEILCDLRVPVYVKRIGLDFSKGYCYEYGGRENLRTFMGIDEASLICTVREFISQTP